MFSFSSSIASSLCRPSIHPVGVDGCYLMPLCMSGLLCTRVPTLRSVCPAIMDTYIDSIAVTTPTTIEYTSTTTTTTTLGCSYLGFECGDNSNVINRCRVFSASWAVSIAIVACMVVIVSLYTRVALARFVIAFAVFCWMTWDLFLWKPEVWMFVEICGAHCERWRSQSSAAPMVSVPLGGVSRLYSTE